MQALRATGETPHCRHGYPLPPADTIGQLFRDYGEEYIKVFHPEERTIRLIRSIRVCRTPALGGRRVVCGECGHTRYEYFSCGNSQCPQCQGIKRLQWQDRLAARMLRVPYCHITFTLPHELSGLARRNAAQVYDLLLRSAWQVVSVLCARADNAGGRPGMTAVLHTWGSDLKYHVHAHCLVTFGGLSGDAAPVWKWPRRKNKLAPFRKLCATFRCVMLRGLKQLLQSGQASYEGDYAVLEAELERKRWVVNHQPPTADTKVIEEYLGRYISRIGISNKRFHYDVQSGQVRIEYNDYVRQQPGQPAPKAYRTLPPLVAMHQLLQHQTPAHFQRVRHYGLHSASARRKIGRQLPQAVKKEGQTVRTLIQILRALLGTEPFRCEQCGSTGFEVQPISSSRRYLHSQVLHRDRSPPFGLAGKTDHWINTSSRGGEPEPALSER